MDHVSVHREAVAGDVVGHQVCSTSCTRGGCRSCGRRLVTHVNYSFKLHPNLFPSPRWRDRRTSLAKEILLYPIVLVPIYSDSAHLTRNSTVINQKFICLLRNSM